jgi:TP901 family phage tail tape measure protein
MGYNVEDASVAIGLMANAGIKGSQAGNTLKNAIVNMVKPTDAMAGVMEKYGLSVTNQDGTMKSLAEITDMLREKMGGLSEEEKANAAATLFGKESMAGMLSVINASPADYEKLSGAINNCDGKAKEMADTMNNNTKGSITALKSAIEGLMIQGFDAMKPTIDAIVAKLRNFTEWLSKLSPETQALIIKIGLFVAAIGPVLLIIGKVITAVSSIIKVFSAVKTAISVVSGAFTLLCSPVGLVVAAIAAVVAIGIVLYKNGIQSRKNAVS